MKFSTLSVCFLGLVGLSSFMIEGAPVTEVERPHPRGRRPSRPSSSAPSSSSSPDVYDERRVINQLDNTLGVLAHAFDVLFADSVNLIEGTTIKIEEDPEDGSRSYKIEIPLEGVKKEDVKVKVDDKGDVVKVKITAVAKPDSSSSRASAPLTESRRGPETSRSGRYSYGPPPEGYDDLTGVNWVVQRGDRAFWQEVLDRREHQLDNMAPNAEDTMAETETDQESGRRGSAETPYPSSQRRGESQRRPNVRRGTNVSRPETRRGSTRRPERRGQPIRDRDDEDRPQPVRRQHNVALPPDAV